MFIPEYGANKLVRSKATLLDYIFISHETVIFKEGSIIGRGGPQAFETSRLSRLLGNWHTDGGEVVSLKRRAPGRALPPPPPAGRGLVVISVRD
jgi:hypothetical protein